jgi:hypothetical protein
MLLIALAAFLFPGLDRAEGTPTLPSRKAVVVLPLLERFSKGDDYSKIEKILGKPDMDIGSGIYIYVFRLNDSTSVTVGTPNRNLVYSIRRTGHGIDGTQIIFSN